MARNIELKAVLRDVDGARRTALELATEPPTVERQVDTYFAVPHGRLKLREIDGRAARLVWYARADQVNAKASDYQLLPVADAAGLKELLAAALGVVAVVDKRREIFLHHNVRIHLDEVVALGRFLEFEAVLNDGIDDDVGRAQVARLCEVFGLRQDDLISRSYGDLLRKQSTTFG